MAIYLRTIFDSDAANAWPKKRLGDIALSVQNGIYKAAENYGLGQPFIRMYNVQNKTWQLGLSRIALVMLHGKDETAAGAGVKTNLLFFTRSKQTKSVCYYDLSDLKVNKGPTLHSR